MKKYIFIILTLVSCKTSRSSLEHEYNNAITEINPLFDDVISKINGDLFRSEGNGAAIFLKSSTDIIESNNDYKNWEYSEMDTIEQSVWISASKFDGKILTISFGQFFGNQFINHYVEYGKIKTEFIEYYKSDDLLKLQKNDSAKNELNIPLESVEVSLSKVRDFKSGEIIYGKSKIITKPYYLKPMGFDFEQVKQEYEYYFKFKIRTKE